MATHVSIHPADQKIKAEVRPLPLGNFHLEIEAGDVRISVFGDAFQAAGLLSIATILNATFRVQEMPARRPLPPRPQAHTGDVSPWIS